jgi:hypothetical protein
MIMCEMPTVLLVPMVVVCRRHPGAETEAKSLPSEAYQKELEVVASPHPCRSESQT